MAHVLYSRPASPCCHCRTKNRSLFTKTRLFCPSWLQRCITFSTLERITTNPTSQCDKRLSCRCLSQLKTVCSCTLRVATDREVASATRLSDPLLLRKHKHRTGYAEVCALPTATSVAMIRNVSSLAPESSSDTKGCGVCRANTR